LWPLIATIITLILHKTLPKHEDILQRDLNFFSVFLVVLIVIFLALIFISFINDKVKRKYAYNSRFIAGVILLICAYNLITLKFNLVPAVYFPYPDRII